MELLQIEAVLAAEILTGKVRIGSREPGHILSIRSFLLQLKKAVGEENFETLMSEAGLPALHALADLIFDKVCETTHPGTIESCKLLPIPTRLIIEALAARATGGSEHGHWAPGWWQVKKHLRQMTDLSVTGITLEIIRNGCHQLVHSIVDELFERRMQFVS